MGETHELLNNLAQVPGIQQTVVVGRDGFVLEAVGDMDSESVGASISSVLSNIEAMGNDCERNALFTIIAEFGNGAILAAPLGGDAVLGVVCNSSEHLGAVRHALKKSLVELKNSL